MTESFSSAARRRRPSIPVVLVATLVVVVLAVLAGYRKVLLKAPRIRVGPLHTENATPSSGALKLIAIGDTGSGDEQQHAVAAAMERRCNERGGVDAILLLGDNVYPDGVESVEDPQWRTKVQDPYGSPCLSAAPIWAVLGNHDYKGNPAAQIEFSLIDKRWHMPNRYYSLEWAGLLRVVAVDSQPMDFCFKPAFCTLDYLFEQIDSSKARWTVAMAHHPLAASSIGEDAHSGAPQGLILRPLLCNRLDAWISGHAHHLEHRQMPGCRMDLFIAGGGGGTLRDVEAGDADTKYLKRSLGFLELDVDRDTFKSRFVGTDGATLYESAKTHE
jgi:acid phosphatase